MQPVSTSERNSARASDTSRHESAVTDEESVAESAA
jgi:hypothetical protein